jgi:hypothetical protein
MVRVYEIIDEEAAKKFKCSICGRPLIEHGEMPWSWASFMRLTWKARFSVLKGRLTAILLNLETSHEVDSEDLRIQGIVRRKW